MFSMSMFDFSAESSANGNSFVTSNFWMYWAATVPLTLVFLMGLKVWMSFQCDTSANDGIKLKQEKTIALQSIHEANLALNTPFYPGKGLPGPVF